nr:ribonuclease H-like domain-containing protein [Tanacetum cinerariifolium]
MFLSQKKYALELLDMAHMANCNPTWMPIDTESKLRSDGDLISDPTLHHSLAGVLQYLTFTRPDISYVVQQVLLLLIPMLIGLVALLPGGLRRSTSGYCVFLEDNLLSWSAKRQHTLNKSSVEAEYIGVASVVAETAWLRNLLRELHTPLLSATLVYCDNVSAMIDIHFVHDIVARDQVRVLHVPSRYQFKRLKGLPYALFEEFRTSLSV